MTKRFAGNWVLVACLSAGLLSGCKQESREYLKALESKDRLILQAYKARRDMLDSLENRNLSKADQAMDLEFQAQQETLLIEALLDSNRPRNPNPALYEQASHVVADLERQRKSLLDQWQQASGGLDSKKADDLSGRIRDVELALAEAYETLKRSQPIGATTMGQVQTRSIPEDQE